VLVGSSDAAPPASVLKQLGSESWQERLEGVKALTRALEGWPAEQLTPLAAELAFQRYRRVVLLLRRIDRRDLTVVEQFPLSAGTLHARMQLVGAGYVEACARRMLELLAVGQHTLAGELRRHPELRQRLKMSAHGLERLHCGRVDELRGGLRRRLRGGRGCGYGWRRLGGERDRREREGCRDQWVMHAQGGSSGMRTNRLSCCVDPHGGPGANVPVFRVSRASMNTQAHP
jgi:hypothetical protein